MGREAGVVPSGPQRQRVSSEVPPRVPLAHGCLRVFVKSVGSEWEPSSFVSMLSFLKFPGVWICLDKLSSSTYFCSKGYFLNRDKRM